MKKQNKTKEEEAVCERNLTYVYCGTSPQINILGF